MSIRNQALVACALFAPLAGCSVVNGYPEVEVEDLAEVKEAPKPAAQPWLTQIGGLGNDMATAVAVSPSGDLIVAGQFEETIDLGLGPLHSYGAQDAFVAGLDDQGHALWNVAWGGSATDLVDGMVAMDDGEVVVAFAFSGVADLGGAVLEGYPFGFGLIRYRDDGEIVWAKSYSGFDTRTWGALQKTPDGGLLLTGILGGAVDLGHGTITSVGQSDIFALRLDGEGETQWCKHFASETTPDPNFANFVRSTVAPDGSVYLTGWVDAGADFEQDIVPADDTYPFLVKLDPDGEVAWVNTPEVQSTAQVFKAVTVEDDGDVVTVGAYLVTNAASSMPGGLVITRWSPEGKTIKEERFPATPTNGWSVFPLSIDADPNGDLVIVGSIGADITLGEDTLVAVGGQDTFAARLSSDMSPIDARRFGDNNDQTPWAATVDDDASVLLAGAFEGQLRIDQQSVVSVGASDAFLAKLVW
jgi:hypothetical protein